VLLTCLRAKGNRRKITTVRKPLITVPSQLSLYDPVFDSVDRIENDYHRFCQRTAEDHW
jgi:hypothetical protein